MLVWDVNAEACPLRMGWTCAIPSFRLLQRRPFARVLEDAVKNRIVVVPLALVAACTGVSEEPRDAGPGLDAVGEQAGGGSSGSTPEDASVDGTDDDASGGASGSNDATTEGQDCGPWGASGADPAPAPLNCNLWEHGEQFNLSSTFDGSVLEVHLEYYGGLGQFSDLTAVVSPELGTLLSVTPPAGSGAEIYPFVSVRIALAAGASEGTVTVHGVLHGKDQCHVTVACPVERILHVKVHEAGPPEVSLSAPERLGPRQMVERRLSALLSAKRRG